MTNALSTGRYGRVNPGVAFSATENVTAGGTDDGILTLQYRSSGWYEIGHSVN